MYLFELSMPSVNTWNGRWTGEDSYYAIALPDARSGKAESGKQYGYNFGDGWYAKVSCRHVTAAQGARARRRSRGFCGYDWMVEEIVKHGRILTLDERAIAEQATGRRG